jgi:hypothetical protein
MSTQPLGQSASCAVVSSALVSQLSGLCYQAVTAVLAITNPRMQDIKTLGTKPRLAKRVLPGAMKWMACPGRFIHLRVRISYVP